MTTPKSLEFLEQQRVNITNQIAALGDLRGGSITSTTGRCGKPNCHCHQPKDPGHGPNLRLTFKINGKTVTASLPDQPATRTPAIPGADHRAAHPSLCLRPSRSLSGTTFQAGSDRSGLRESIASLLPVLT